MSRQINLRNNGDITFCRIFDDVLYFLLRIKTTVWFSVEFPFGANFGQLRVFFNFDTPSLVISQVPMEGIQVMESNNINVFLDEISREEMTAYVEMHSPVAVFRLV